MSDSSDPVSPLAVDPAYDRLARFVEQKIPFNAVLGIRVEMMREGECVLRVPWNDTLIGDRSRPAVHGGVISTLADTAGGAACFTTLRNRRDRASTVDLRVDYLRPGPAQDLYCHAKTIRVGNRVAVARMEVFSGSMPDLAHRQSGEVEPIATAQGVYNIVRRKD